MLGRYGGDEFLALLPVGTATVTDELAERLGAVLQSPVHAAGRLIRLGISIGIARPTTPQETLQDLLHRADQAMYATKRQARPLN